LIQTPATHTSEAQVSNLAPSEFRWLDEEDLNID
jgi:hypothetical protein